MIYTGVQTLLSRFYVQIEMMVVVKKTLCRYIFKYFAFKKAQLTTGKPDKETILLKYLDITIYRIAVSQDFDIFPKIDGCPG